MSKSRVSAAQLLGAVMLLGLAAVPANAATYNWSFDCGEVICSGSGSLETNVAIGPALVTSFSGFFGGSAITSLLAVNGFAGNDNIVFSLTSPELSTFGISVTTASFPLNLYHHASLPSDVWLIDNGDNTQTSGLGTFSVSPSAVPIPAALPLFAAGLSAMGFMGWRRKRRTP
jgi:hypothetical protein